MNPSIEPNNFSHILVKDFSLKDKRFIVVGGAGRLGSKICEGLVLSGGNCILADIDQERANKVISYIEKKYGIIIPFCSLSATDSFSVEKMIVTAEDSLGGIDGLVNSSYPKNRNYGRKLEDVEYKDFCENINLHLGSYFLVSQLILKYFRIHKGGTLLNISSIYGVVAPRFSVYQNTEMTMPVEYAAIKSSIIHLTKYFAKYYAGNNIRVNCISLGGLRDNQPNDFLQSYKSFCLDKGMLDADDIIGTIIFLFSDLSRYINGQNICVDDGFTL